MKEWQQLVGQALLGTGRQSALPSADGPLGEVLARCQRQEAEQALLAAAAVLDLYRRAGQRPERTDQALPLPAPDETLPLCPARAAALLARILGGEGREVLGEWLEIAHCQGLRVPPPLLGALLEQGRVHPELQPLIAATAGRRGVWLAQCNPDWLPLFATPDTNETVWQTGDRATRLQWFTRLRQSDPEKARTLLQHGWAAEAARDRSALLAGFASGLSAADEPFLEACLDDRSREVRATAARLLAQLPDSQLVERIFARCTPLLSLAATGIAVELPDTCTPAMQRDGIDPKFSFSGGERAGWLHQMLAAVPPQRWYAHWQRSAGQIVAACEGEWQRLLRVSFAAAAARFADAQMIAALSSNLDLEVARHLIPGLAPDVCEALALEHLRSARPPFDALGLLLLGACCRPWSAPLTAALLDALEQSPSGAQQLDWNIGQLLVEAALRMDPAFCERTECFWQGNPHQQWQWVGRQMISRLRFRRELYLAFDRLTEELR